MSVEIDRLIDALRALEDRVSELERALGSSVSVVGFEVDYDDDFDEEDSEYRVDGHDPMCRPHRG